MFSSFEHGIYLKSKRYITYNSTHTQYDDDDNFIKRQKHHNIKFTVQVTNSICDHRGLVFYWLNLLCEQYTLLKYAVVDVISVIDIVIADAHTFDYKENVKWKMDKIASFTENERTPLK